jgi:hypothetical protein
LVEPLASVVGYLFAVVKWIRGILAWMNIQPELVEFSEHRSSHQNGNLMSGYAIHLGASYGYPFPVPLSA